MDKFKRSLSFRKKRDSTPESSKPHQWQEDEKKVRDATCSFQVRYLGCIEVFESRGIQVCEEAIKGLKTSKGKYQRAILYVSGDALRVVDEINKGLIVDQTIEKVSFCAPDRNNEKGFAYICRDGTTRRWMCHGFMTLKESGERLSHAVGCAFTVCLERKQAREKEKVTVVFNENGTSFTRTGSFRQTTLTERIADPQSAIIAEPVPVKKTENLYEIQRPRASVDLLQRQNSFRGFSKLAETSPFKRQMSLRLDELSSTAERLKQFVDEEDGIRNGVGSGGQPAHVAISPIMEASPMTEAVDTISRLCQQVTHGLSVMTSDDPFLVVPAVARLGMGTGDGGTAAVSLSQTPSQTDAVQRPAPVDATSSSASSAAAAAGSFEPIRQNNPWASPQTHPSKVSDADFWLHSTAKIIGGGTGNPEGRAPPQSSLANGVMPASSGPSYPLSHQPISAGAAEERFNSTQRAPRLTHFRAPSVDSAHSGGQSPASYRPGYQMFYAAGGGGAAQPFGGSPMANDVRVGSWSGGGGGGSTGVMGTVSQPVYDPFDAAWAAKVAGRSTNPFHSFDSSSKSFEVKL